MLSLKPAFKTVSKFQPLSLYEESLTEGYHLLPFRFTRLKDDEYVLTNQAGEYVTVAREIIEELVRHRLSPTSEVYCDLKSKHFLMDADSNVAIDLLTLKVRTKLSRLSEFTALHMFVVTLRCEHSCPYCQVSRQSDDKHAFDMTEETANQALTHTFRSPSRAIKIEFQGGESLLNFPMVQFIVERAKAINEVENRHLEFVIATNLALINDEILAFCRTHKILISTSLDGPANLHNKNRHRPGGDSYERTIAGITKARLALGRDQVSALMTTSEASLGRVHEIIDEYIRQGFEGIFLRSMSPYGYAIKTKWYSAYGTDQWLDFYFEGLDYIIELNKSGYFFCEHFAGMILTKMLTPFDTGYVDQMSPAGIGIAAIIYNYDGDVYASDESRMLAEMGDDTFRLGNVRENTYEEIILSDALLTPLEESFAASVPMCSECAFEPYCGAEPVRHHVLHGDFVGRKPLSTFCNRNMEIFRRLISLMEKDDEIRKIFQSWIVL
jgi:uncharacterized protein